MSKYSKLINTPREFFRDIDYSTGKAVAFSVAGYLQPWARTAWVFNVSKWKRALLRKYFPNHRMRFLALKESLYAKHAAIRMSVNPVFIVWGMIQPDDLTEYASEFNIPIVRVEDGFFRSIGLGAEHNPPYSLCIDKSGIYFDSSQPSDLEKILASYDFAKNRKLLVDAQQSLAEIREHGLSKYNEVIPPKAQLLYGPKVKPRILVIGQVEDDQSLLYGCSQIMTNVELIRLAARENPDAQIVYKTHPDILAGKRTEISDPQEVADLAEIISTSLALKDALHEVDRVYTLTSLGGFEALVHGVPVTTVGAPFYSGWGLTDDRQVTGRRNRKLTLEELFAGAYLLYPRYYDPEQRKSTTLPAVIDTFKERLAEIKLLTPDAALERLRPFNFATRNAVSSRYIYNSSAKSVVLVSDTAESLLVAKGFAAKGKKVTLLSTRDALANTDEMLLTFEESQNITISSLHKRYSVALSKIEANSVELATTFSSDLAHVISKAAGRHIPKAVVDALALGMEDHIYFEALRFYAAKACLEEFDSVVLLIDNFDTNVDVVKSFVYHGAITRDLGRVYFHALRGHTKEIVQELFSPERIKFDGLLDEAAVVADFTSFWWELQDSRYDDYAGLDGYIAVCGNVAKDNYAYLPASMKLVETLAQKSNRTLLLYSSGLLGADGQDEVKTLTLLERLSPHCTVYNGCLPKFQTKYPQSVLDRTQMFTDRINEWFLMTARKRLPYQFIDIFRPRLEKFVQGLFTQTIFIAESMRAMERCKLFATAMDRSMVSRILSAIAETRGIPTIGIQPQIISASPRYLKPAVQRMGVIDDAQAEVFAALGANKSSLTVIGSVNIIARLVQMDECTAQASTPASPSRVLFAMQHSNAFEMVATSIALREISRKLNLEIIVKPHPHQELPVLHEVRRIFSQSDNVKVLSRESDTYVAAASCGIVVGLFSSVLLEAALSGKPVVVAAFRDLHPSIDFSVRGLALKALNPQELEMQLLDILQDGPLLAGLRASTVHYLQQNPQFGKPYSHTYIDRFLNSAINQH